MALPINATPVYTLEIPSSKKPLKYRPFLVKDEKALLIAQQSDNVDVMLDTIHMVIAACTLNDIDVNTLTSFDIEYIFLQMRAHSVGEVIELVFSCDDDHGEHNGEARVTKSINLFTAVVEEFEGHSRKIPLFDEVGIMMKYPTASTLKKLMSALTSADDQAIDVFVDCVDYVYDGDEIHKAAEQSRAEMVQFFDNLTRAQFDQVKEFFHTMPQVRLYVDYTCPYCGKDHHKHMEGLSSFF